MSSTAPNVELDEFLKTEESRSLKNPAIGRRFGVSEAAVRRAKIRLEKAASRPQPDGKRPPPSSPSAPAPPSGTVSMVPMDGLNLDAGTRVRPTDPETVQRYAHEMGEADDPGVLGALVAYRVEGYGLPLLCCGFQRHAAARIVWPDGRDLPVVIKEGTFAEALQEAMRDNRAHGRPLSRQERIDIVVRLFDEWGDWTDVRIAKAIGEKDRKLISEVRKLWHEQKGTKDTGPRLAERNGQEYPIQPGRPDRGPDAAEQDDVDIGDEDQDQQADRAPADPKEVARREEANLQFLTAIPVRAQIHPRALPAFDREAILYRDVVEEIRSRARNACARHKPPEGEEPGPVYRFLERIGSVARPIPLEKKDPVTGHPTGKTEPGFSQCRACKDENGQSTGRVPGQDGTPCPACHGYAVKIPGM